MPLIRIENIANQHAIGVWKIDEEEDQLMSLLQPTEQALRHITPITVEQKRKERLAARLLVKDLLARFDTKYCGMDYKETGAPYLIDCSLNVTFSHSAGYVAALISPNAEIGIDIQQVDPKIGNIRDRIFSKMECEHIGRDPDLMTIYWGAKEVLYKIYQRRSLNFIDHLQLDIINNKTQGHILGKIDHEGHKAQYLLSYKKLGNHFLIHNHFENS